MNWEYLNLKTSITNNMPQTCKPSCSSPMNRILEIVGSYRLTKSLPIVLQTL